LFIHGAGGFIEDQGIADALRARPGVTVDMPQLSDEDMTVETWAATVREGLSGLGADDVVIGHSFGATILQWVLPEVEWPPGRALLLATPDWSPEGWDVPQYVPPVRELSMATSLHHCRDDDVVPVHHLALNAARLPSAQVYEHPSGGHQFDGRVETLLG
jgi:predicted alpha/beta hydrolase family esterase